MSINPMDLTGKRILVTGASSGIGKATSQLLSKLGARVVLLARDATRSQETLETLEGDGHGLYVFDLSAIDEIPSYMKKIAKEQGPLAGLFHSAGVSKASPISILKSTTIDFTYNTGIKAALLLTKGFCQPGVKITEATSVVYMSSIAALRGLPGMSVYCSGKAAIDGAVRSLAQELAPKNIRVNSIIASGVRGHMFEDSLKIFTPQELEEYKKDYLLGFGTPEDVANAAAFLLSDAAKWITGTTMIVDGGVCT